MEHKKKMFQEFIRVQIHDYRSGRAYTQEQMAELLHVAPRSYFDQEHGKYGFSAVTVIFCFLMLSREEALSLLEELDELLNEEIEDE